MIINQISPAVTSLYEPSIFELSSFSELDISNLYVDIIDAKSAKVIGVKHCQTLPSHINVTPYARRLIDLKPVKDSINGIFSMLDSHFCQIKIRVGTLLSDTMTILPLRNRFNNDGLVSLAPLNNILHFGDCYHHLFYTGKVDGSIWATFIVSTLQGKEFSYQYETILSSNNILSMRLDTADIKAQAELAGFKYEDCASIKVKLFNSHSLLTETSCKLMSARNNNNLRLCWLNRMGGFSYYDFSCGYVPNLEVSRSKVNSSIACRAGVTSLAYKYELNSDYVHSTQIDDLTDLLYSDHIWIVDNNHKEAVIEKHKIDRHPNNLHSVSLTISSLWL